VLFYLCSTNQFFQLFDPLVEYVLVGCESALCALQALPLSGQEDALFAELVGL